MTPANILSELLPRKARLFLYLAVFLLSTGLTLWQASEGNWLIFATSLLTALVTLLAAGNSTAPAIEASANKLPDVVVVHETVDNH